MKHLQRAFDGQNQIWKFFVVILIALIGGQLIGAIPLVIAIVVSSVLKGAEFTPPENTLDFAAYGINPSLGLVLIVIPFITTLLIAIPLVKALHHRTLKDVINGGENIRLKRVLVGALVWGSVLLIGIVTDIFVNSDNYSFQFNLMAFVPLVLVTFLFIPLQSATEEYLFRGYLAQGVGGWTKNRIMVILIPSLFFALLHSTNPEVKEHGFLVMMPHYLMVGLTFGVISVLDDGIELAMGAHAINNCLSSILVTSKESVLQTPALFVEKETDPSGDFIFLIITSLLVLLIFQLIYKWNFKVLFQKLKPLTEVQSEIKDESIRVED